MKIDLSKTPFENCPSFERCNCNACPLHPNYLKTLFNLPEDKEIWGWKRCRTGKKIRMRIAKEFKLKNLGLTKKETASYRMSLLQKQGVSTLHEPMNIPKSQGENKQINPLNDCLETNSKHMKQETNEVLKK